MMSEDDRKVRWAEMHSTGKISREIYEDQQEFQIWFSEDPPRDLNLLKGERKALERKRIMKMAVKAKMQAGIVYQAGDLVRLNPTLMLGGLHEEIGIVDQTYTNSTGMQIVYIKFPSIGNGHIRHFGWQLEKIS
jgi:hypothetical protein